VVNLEKLQLRNLNRHGVSEMGWDAEEPEAIAPKTELVEDDKVLETPVDTSVTIDDDDDDDFFSDEASDDKKEIFAVYGLKNDGKTSITYGIPHEGQRVLVFSFDNKSTRPISTEYVQAGKLDIKVFNVIKLIDKSSDPKCLESSVKAREYILKKMLHAETKFKPNWIVFDGTEVMSSIMEWVMRKNNNLKLSQGIANRTLWKERRMFLDDIHLKALNLATDGVIYTMYSAKDELIEDGATVQKKDIPIWVGSIMQETDITIKAEAKFESGMRQFYAKVEGSKLPKKYPDGIYNITGKRFRDKLVEVIAGQQASPTK